jgi:hypothetical protein
MKKLFSIIAVAALGLATCVVTQGCASAAKKLLASPPPSHVVHLVVSGKKGQLGYDTMTGSAAIQYGSVYASLTTIPVYAYTDSNGIPHLLVPPVAISYEIAGKGIVFGSAGSTFTLGTGDGVLTQLIGQHQPVNEGFYGTNNLMTYSQLTTSTGSATPVAQKTVQTVIGTGTNAVTTTTTTATPVISAPGL